ncbi:MAG TPA: ABC transporter permease [Gammaproteobacteria bacterium]|nr:ABC transporter permease [Gammaproteobacteria bacterium]
MKAIFIARNLEYLRDRASFGWNLVFPVLIVFALAVVFSGPPRALFVVTAIGTEALPEMVNFPGIEMVSDQEEKALDRLSRQQTDLVLKIVDGGSVGYWVNGNSASGAILELLLKYTEDRPLQREETDGAAIRYVDWVVPGILGMNMMYSALWGVGYVIVRYRQSGYLRRLKATPLTKLEFLSAQVLSRLLVTLTASAIVFVGTNLMLDYKMVGSIILLLITALIGGLAMITLGLAIACRTESKEFADGLLNAITFPMLLLSDVWFSLDGSPEWVQMIAQVLPLTHVLEAARAVMLDDAGFTDIAPNLGLLCGFCAVGMGISVRLFRW